MIALRRFMRALVIGAVVVGSLSPAAGRAQSGRQLPPFIQTQAWIRLAKDH
jgi:hypothetical protein